MIGGTQPPLTQTQPLAGAAVAQLLVEYPGAYHWPLKYTPPPTAVYGSGGAQPVRPVGEVETTRRIVPRL